MITITDGPIAKVLLAFFFPILFGTLFQQLYNTVDAIIVGRFVGKEALAAVGGGTGVFVNLMVGLFTGIANGASVVISQYYGAKEKQTVQEAIHTAMAMACVGGILVMIVGLLISRWALTLMGTPQKILELSLLYLNIFFIGTVPMFLYNMGAGILRSMGDSRHPLYILIAGCFTNIILDILFVTVFGWGIEGVAWATIFSETESMFLVFVCLKKNPDQEYQFHLKKVCLHRKILLRMLYLGIPTGLQASMYNISNIIIQGSINSLGTNIIAANAAYGKIDTIFWMGVNSFGVAMTIFSGQNFGAGNLKRVYKGTWVCLGLCSLLALFSTTMFLLFGKYFFFLFTTDSEVIKDGMTILHMIAPAFITYISIEILSGTIRGCGQSIVPTIFTAVGVCLLRIVWISVVFPMKRDISTVMFSYPLTWIVTSILFWCYYHWGHWMDKKNI